MRKISLGGKTGWPYYQFTAATFSLEQIEKSKLFIGSKLYSQRITWCKWISWKSACWKDSGISGLYNLVVILHIPTLGIWRIFNLSWKSGWWSCPLRLKPIAKKSPFHTLVRNGDLYYLLDDFPLFEDYLSVVVLLFMIRHKK